MAPIAMKVKKMHGDTFDFEVDSDWTVPELKARLGERLSAPPGDLRIIYLGRVVKDTQTVSELGLREQGVLLVVQQNDPAAPAATHTTSSSSSSSSSSTATTATSTVTQPTPAPAPAAAAGGPAGAGAGAGAPGGVPAPGVPLPPGMPPGLQGLISGMTQGMPAGANVVMGPLGFTMESSGNNLDGVMQSLMGAARGVAQRASEQATQQQQQQQQQQPGAPAAPPAAAAAAAAGQSQQPQQPPAAAPASAAAGAAAPAAAQASSAPFVQGVHVVVHATPSDLESLPRRLDVFQREVQQLRSDLPIHVVGAGGAAAAGGPTGTTWGPPQQPQQQQQQPGGQQVNDFVGGVFDGISGIMRGASPIISALGQAAAAGQQQQQQQQQAAPAAQPAPGAGAAPAAAPTGPQPRHLMDKIAMEAARVLQLPEMMGIAMTGNLEPLNKLEPVAVRHLQEALQPADTPAARRELAAAGGRAAADGVRENAEAMDELLRACGGSEAERDAALAETEKVAAEHAWRLAEAVLAGAGEAPTQRQFHNVLSETAGRGAGHWAERMRRRFRGGAADVERVLAAVTKRDVNHAITLLPPGLAPLAAAAAPNAIARVVQWLLRAHREYAAGGAEGEGERRLAADDEACGLPTLAAPAEAADDATYGGALSEEDARALEELASAQAPAVPAQPLSENYTSGSR